jgi:hypothetical protein
MQASGFAPVGWTRCVFPGEYEPSLTSALLLSSISFVKIQIYYMLSTPGAIVCFFLYWPSSGQARQLHRTFLIWPSFNRIFADMGGPMIEASIEDLGNHIVAICPWHKYRINLRDGDGVYNALPDGELRSKGKRQRVWPTRIVDDWVEVKIYWPEKRDLPSDAYQTKDLAERKRLGLS